MKLTEYVKNVKLTEYVKNAGSLRFVGETSVKVESIGEPSPTPAVPAMTAAEVDATRHLVTVSNGADAEYIALMQELGIVNVRVRVDGLKRFLSDENIMVYPMESVGRYLEDKALAIGRGTVWCWMPVRAKDRKVPSEASYDYQHGSIRATVLYPHLIPYVALLTMKKIADAFPDAEFYASDYVTRKPDPFLAVKIKGSDEMFVVERWNEPGYRS